MKSLVVRTNKERVAGSLELTSWQVWFESSSSCKRLQPLCEDKYVSWYDDHVYGKKKREREKQMCLCVWTAPKMRWPGTDHTRVLHIITTSRFVVRGSLHSLKISLLHNAFPCSGIYGHENRHMDPTCAGKRERKRRKKKNWKKKTHKHPAESSINKLKCACGGRGDVWCRLSAALFNYCSPGPKA